MEDAIMDIKIDSTVTLEGLIASISIFFAAVGYILNLISNWLEARKTGKEHADDLLILEILERSPFEGFTAEAVHKDFLSSEFAQLRKKLKTSRTGKISVDYIEDRLRRLQYDHFVDRSTMNTYVLRTGFDKTSDLRRELQKKRSLYLRERVNDEKLLSLLKTGFDDMETWEQERIIDIYAKFDMQGLDELIRQLDSNNKKISVAAARRITEIIYYQQS